jgi:hypothetical protein
MATPPRRYYWLKRLAVAYVALVAATVSLRYGWVRSARTALDAEVAAYRAAGEPILPADFNAPSIPEGENAAVELRAAAAGDLDALNGEGLRGTPGQVIAGHLRRARAMPRIEWGVKFESPLVSIMLPDLAGQRSLAGVASKLATFVLADGREADAIEHDRDTLFVARATGRQPFLVAGLVGAAISGRATTTITAQVPTLKLTDPAARDAARALIADLLDDAHVRTDAVRALYGERAMQLDSARLLAGGRADLAIGGPSTPADRAMLWWIRPLIEQDARRMIAHTTAHARAVAQPTYPAAVAAAPANLAKGGATALESIRYPVSRVLMTALGRATIQGYTAQNDRRFAAVRLAARLYRAERGHDPERIEDLVPDYLKQVPVSPMTGLPFTLAGATRSATTAPSR